MSTTEPSKPSCAFCRSRKVRCNNSTPQIETCDQCLRHGQTCVYLAHQRGRKLGSRNKKQFELTPGTSRISHPTSISEGSIRLDDPPHNDSQFPAFDAFDAVDEHHADASSLPGRIPSVARSRDDQGPAGHISTTSPLDMISEAAQGRAGVTTFRPPPVNLPSRPNVRSGWLDKPRFAPKLDVERSSDPIVLGICSSEMADVLLEFFWDHLANYAGFFDKRLHTLHYLQDHSTFLLSTILHIAARHATKDEIPGVDLVSSVLERHILVNLWPRVLLNNHRSVQICQALMLWATFLPEPRPGEDDLSWSLFGHASELLQAFWDLHKSAEKPDLLVVRIAVDVGLNCDRDRQSSRDDQRTWITCYIADRSWATQLDRPPMLAENGLLLRLEDWLRDEETILEDHSLVALSQLRRIMAGTNSAGEVSAGTVQAVRDRLEDWRDRWLNQYFKDSIRLGRLGKVYYHYANIALHLSWLSRSGAATLQYRHQLELDVLNHAAQLLNHVAVDLPRSVFRFAHNNFFTMVSFACAVLVKFKSARFDDDQTSERYEGDLANIALALQQTVNLSTHHLGVVRWHAEFFNTAMSSMRPGPQLATTWDDLLREMAMPTFPGNLMDIMSLDWQNWETGTDWQPC